MKFEYEGVFFIGWVIRFVIFQQVSDYRFKRIYLFTIPIIFTFVEYFFYDVVFWCEFFFLPLIVLFIKTKKHWSWVQSLFYCFFTLAIYEIFSSLSALYFQFVFKISETTLENNVWLDWIPTLLSFPLYVLFLKLVRIDLNTLSREIKNNKLIQNPVEEINKLRKDKKYIKINSNINEDAYDTFDMIVNLEKCDKLESIIKNCVNLSYDREKQLFTLSFTQGDYGRTNRSVSLDKLNNFRVLCDKSSIEIFINNGEEVFTTRFYPTKDNVGIKLSGENLKGSICIYEMEAYKIEN